jgi:hypothetical protein
VASHALFAALTSRWPDFVRNHPATLTSRPHLLPLNSVDGRGSCRSSGATTICNLGVRLATMLWHGSGTSTRNRSAVALPACPGCRASGTSLQSVSGYRWHASERHTCSLLIHPRLVLPLAGHRAAWAAAAGLLPRLCALPVRGGEARFFCAVSPLWVLRRHPVWQQHMLVFTTDCVPAQVPPTSSSEQTVSRLA